MLFSDLRPTGREVAAPASDLVEMVSRAGNLHTAIRFHERWRDHAALDVARGWLSFLRSPSVAGIAEVELYDPETRTWVYPTGQAWSVAELVGLVADLRPIGTRAALELCHTAALTLENAARMGEPQGLYNHGGLSPWRVLVEEDGDVAILGYGLPQVDALEGAQDAAVDTLRYCPPERLEGEDEDISSDLFALSLIGFELMTGEPVYDGSSRERVRELARRAVGDRQVWRWRDQLGEDVRAVLGRALKPYPDARYAAAHDYARAVDELLGSPVAYGPSLAELMQKVAATWRRPVPLDLPKQPQPEARWTAPAREPGLEKREQQVRSDAERLAVSQQAFSTSQRQGQRQRRTSVGLSAPIDTNTLFPRVPPEGETERFLVRMEGARGRWARISPDETLATSAARLVDALCPSPISLSGEVAGWYRVVQGDASWFGWTRTRVLVPTEPVDLEFVPNRVVPITFALHRRDEVERFEAHVGTAVHAQLLLSALRYIHDLRERDWRLYVEDDRPLDRWQILDDYDPQPGLEIVVRRKGQVG